MRKCYRERIEDVGTTRHDQARAMMPAVAEDMAAYETSMGNLLRLADGAMDAQLSEQTGRLRDSAAKSKAASDKLKTNIAAGVNRLNDRVDNLAKMATEEYETASRLTIITASIGIPIAGQQRKADMIKLADGFEAAVSEIIETVSLTSTELEASAGTLTSTATRAQELTTMVAAASEEASTNVQSVASATEELTSSVNGISRQVQESARMASEAVDQARKTNNRVGELSKATSANVQMMRYTAHSVLSYCLQHRRSSTLS